MTGGNALLHNDLAISSVIAPLRLSLIARSPSSQDIRSALMVVHNCADGISAMRAGRGSSRDLFAALGACDERHLKSFRRGGARISGRILFFFGLEQHEKERYPIHSYHAAKALALRRTSQGRLEYPSLSLVQISSVVSAPTLRQVGSVVFATV